MPMTLVPIDDSDEMCAQVQQHLPTFWSTPELLDLASMALIDEHVKNCVACSEKFVDVSNREPAPWA